MIHAARFVAALLTALALSACQPIVRHHGYVPDGEALSQVVVGQTTQGELTTLLGTPGAEGVLTNSAWFYARSTFQQIGPARPSETNREVVAISFADNGTVANVERFGLERGRIVRLSTLTTDPGVSAASALRRILANFGRFRASEVLNR